MRSETILRHIDKNIINNLSSKNFDLTRQALLTISNKFKQRIENNNLNLSLSQIEKISETRQRYTAMYVFFSEKRIIDLYKVEKMFLNKSAIKAYETFLFKEKLEKCIPRPFIYNNKYIKFWERFKD
jgi:hypothetical protein